jgi:hypothetical protein
MAAACRAISTMDNELQLELQHAFEEAIAKYSRWQGGDEPTVNYQNARSLDQFDLQSHDVL